MPVCTSQQTAIMESCICVPGQEAGFPLLKNKNVDNVYESRDLTSSYNRHDEICKRINMGGVFSKEKSEKLRDSSVSKGIKSHQEYDGLSGNGMEKMVFSPDCPRNKYDENICGVEFPDKDSKVKSDYEDEQNGNTGNTDNRHVYFTEKLSNGCETPILSKLQENCFDQISRTSNPSHCNVCEEQIQNHDKEENLLTERKSSITEIHVCSGNPLMFNNNNQSPDGVACSCHTCSQKSSPLLSVGDQEVPSSVLKSVNYLPSSHCGVSGFNGSEVSHIKENVGTSYIGSEMESHDTKGKSPDSMNSFSCSHNVETSCNGSEKESHDIKGNLTTCSQCGETSPRLTRLIDEMFCEKCQKDFEQHELVAFSQSLSSFSNRHDEMLTTYSQSVQNDIDREFSLHDDVKAEVGCIDQRRAHHRNVQDNDSQTLSENFELNCSTIESGFYENEVENYEVLQEVDEQTSEEDEIFSDAVEGNTVLQTSSEVQWEGNFMCTCEECLKGLRIERIETADKMTMCPEEPPYVLMCEICEELLENQLQKTEKDTKKKEEVLKREIKELKRENEAAQKVINQNLQLGPEAKIEATMQHEITRLTSENLDLRENLDKQSDQLRKLKKMLKVYSKRLKDGEAAEIAAELEKDDKQGSVDNNVATIKHRDRSYMGMLEYKKEDEASLIKSLIMDLKPKVASGLLPGLPSYLLFMCVRHTDYINDDEKVRSLLTNTINGIKKCVKKHHTDLDRVMMWLANTCRLLHTLKQYSGEKAFQTENTTRQNEHCLRNFDLSEYRQVFSDLAVWIYQTMIKQMEEALQAMVVPAVLEHEAIAGLTASKPSGMRGRSSSTAQAEDIKELSLDSLMKALNRYSQILTTHAVDPELVKQVFRQIYYFICAGALNNLLLRKDMCNWSKGMQIRYNLSHLEQWLRDNKLNESGAQTTLEPITQASQLLQARKTDADVESICEMCSKLTTPQIVKILNLYTPVDEFEERVPISFIRKIQERLKSRQDDDNTLLMDTKYSYPVTFPFNPSSVALDSVEIPESLHVGFLTRV